MQQQGLLTIQADAMELDIEFSFYQGQWITLFKAQLITLSKAQL